MHELDAPRAAGSSSAAWAIARSRLSSAGNSSLASLIGAPAQRRPRHPVPPACGSCRSRPWCAGPASGTRRPLAAWSRPVRRGPSRRSRPSPSMSASSDSGDLNASPFDRGLGGARASWPAPSASMSDNSGSGCVLGLGGDGLDRPAAWPSNSSWNSDHVSCPSSTTSASTTSSSEEAPLVAGARRPRSPDAPVPLASAAFWYSASEITWNASFQLVLAGVDLRRVLRGQRGRGRP